MIGKAASRLVGMMPSSSSVAPVALPELPGPLGAGRPHPIDALADVRVSVSVIAGTGRVSLRQLAELAPGQVITIDAEPESPVQLLANGEAFASGLIMVEGSTMSVRVS